MGTNDKLAVLIFVFSLALLMKTPISNPGDFCPFAFTHRQCFSDQSRNLIELALEDPEGINLKDSMKSNPAIVTEVSSRLVAHGHVTSAFESMSCHTFQSYVDNTHTPTTHASFSTIWT